MPRGDRTPFVAGRTLVQVPAMLNRGLRVALIADTGAERMVISRLTAQQLGIDLSQPRRFEPLVGLGRTASVPVVLLDRVQVGGSLVERLEASVYDLPPAFRADGLLGLTFLRRFRVTFEFDARSLVLCEPLRKSP
ncbi:MAG: retropepsin-like aspartic protease family protein [Chloroflexota bacterium]